VFACQFRVHQRMSHGIESRSDGKPRRIVGLFCVDGLLSGAVEPSDPCRNQLLLGGLQGLECPTERARLGLSLLFTCLLSGEEQQRLHPKKQQAKETLPLQNSSFFLES